MPLYPTAFRSPDVTISEDRRFTLLGDWTLIGQDKLEAKAQFIADRGMQESALTLDFSGLTRLDTAGAWLINRLRHQLTESGVNVQLEKVQPEYIILLDQVAYRTSQAPSLSRKSLIFDLLADLGESSVIGLKELYSGVALLGEFTATLFHLVRLPAHFRFTSLVYHMEEIGLRSAPIIILINFLVGAIVAQQGIYQLQKFGATSYAVDLIGILVLRELGVLLTSIMIAGRSGSAITAEIGSMKMREELDALKVMGLSANEVLIVPRILALVITLPILTYLADMSALAGGMLTSWIYGSISPSAFLALLKSAISLRVFLVGIIKAPFMALVIGVIAVMDGLATKSSAESLGRQVTSSVVNSIFMVIVLDGLFAIFFAAINF